MKKSVIIKKNKLQNHVSVETSLKMIFDFDVPIHDLRNGFYHFAALKDFDYSFTCMKCGVDPSILVGDGNWKNTCLRPGRSCECRNDLLLQVI